MRAVLCFLAFALMAAAVAALAVADEPSPASAGNVLAPLQQGHSLGNDKPVSSASALAHYVPHFMALSPNNRRSGPPNVFLAPAYSNMPAKAQPVAVKPEAARNDDKAMADLGMPVDKTSHETLSPGQAQQILYLYGPEN